MPKIEDFEHTFDTAAAARHDLRAECLGMYDTYEETVTFRVTAQRVDGKDLAPDPVTGHKMIPFSEFIKKNFPNGMYIPNHMLWKRDE